jgi:protein-disulfide isomerase
MITFNTRLSAQRSRRAFEISEPTLAPVKVIQYGDFGCVKCGRAATTIKSFRERFLTQIQFAYRHFPRESIHPNAVQAAEAAECARAQNRFWAMHDVLIANQDHLELQYIYGYAEDLGLAMARFTAEMDDEVHLPAVRAHLENGLAAGVQSAPAFLVDGQIVNISCGLGSLFEATENAIRRWRDAAVHPLS